MIPTEVTWDDLAMFGCESREVFNGLSPIERQQVLMASAMYRGVWPPPFPEGVTGEMLLEESE